MKDKVLLLLIIQFFASVISFAQPFCKIDGKTLTLDNGRIKRIITFDSEKKSLKSTSLKLVGKEDEFLTPLTEEFYFQSDGKPLSGLDQWNFVSYKEISGEYKGSGALVILERANPDIRISITYMLYPGLPIIRKKISFTNNGKAEMKIEAIDIERIRVSGTGTGNECWVMNDYARQKSLGQFIGNWYDPVVVIHQIGKHQGVVLGNEAPGVMKRTTAFQESSLLTTGLTHPDQIFGFRKWLKPGKSWESTWVFTGLYAGTDDPWAVLNGDVSDFIRKYLGIRLSVIPEKPVFAYNTWIPFRQNINEKLIYELVDAAAACGIEEFIIDDGWQNSYGDWGIDRVKFPNGLKPVFDYIKSKGMKPGLWISLAAASTNSNVYKQNPDWLVRKEDGGPIYLHNDWDGENGNVTYSMCMTTGWRDYIKGIIMNLVKEHGLEYLKGDFAVVSGAYTANKLRSGCRATNHPAHKDRNESMLEMYQATWSLFDDLHKEAPNLFIDCTYETMGALQLIDLDMCKHAEGDWLSNFHEFAPLGSLRVRQMSWWRTPVTPATAMLIGNQKLDDPKYELSLMSLTGSLPIFLGDPRSVTPEKRVQMKAWADWLRKMQDKHDFMSYRQDLPGYFEPAEGSWDGFQRINSETRSGGIVGFFRQGSAEEQRKVTVNFLDPSLTYDVLRGPGGEKIIRASGRELKEKGFMVKFDKPYDGALFEISIIP